MAVLSSSSPAVQHCRFTMLIELRLLATESSILSSRKIERAPGLDCSFKKRMDYSVSKTAATFDAAPDAGYCHPAPPEVVRMIGMTLAIDPQRMPSSPPPSLRPRHTAISLPDGIGGIGKFSRTPWADGRAGRPRDANSPSLALSVIPAPRTADDSIGFADPYDFSMSQLTYRAIRPSQDATFLDTAIRGTRSYPPISARLPSKRR